MTIAFIYSPRGQAFTPRYGSENHIHTGGSGAFQTYTPPTSGRGNDWLLILEGEGE